MYCVVYMVTPKGKINTGAVINSNCCMHKDTGSEIDVFVIDKPCLLLLCLLRDVYLILFFDTLEVMHFRGCFEDSSPTTRVTFSPHLRLVIL